MFIERSIVHSPDSRDAESEERSGRLHVAGRSQRKLSKEDGKIELRTDVALDFHVAQDSSPPRELLSC